MADTTPEKFTRFAFDNDFFEVTGAPPGRTAAPAAKPAPAAAAKAPGNAPLTGAEPRTIKNVKEALEQGYAEGFAAATQQAEANYNNELNQLRQANKAAIAAFQDALAKTEDQLTRTALTLLRASLHHLVGHAAENYPDQVLETHLKALVAHVSTHEELTLRIAPAARTYHEKLGLTHANVQGVGFHIKEDHGLKPTDCVAEWRRGGAEVKLQEHLTRLDELLISAGADAAPIPAVARTTPPPAATPSGAAPATATPAAPAAPSAASSLADELRADNDLIDALK